VDAYSTEFKTQVVIKRIVDNDKEWRMVARLRDERFGVNPRNHSVRLLDSLEIPGKPAPSAIIVTPLLRDFDKPDFDTVGGFLDFVGQMLEVWYFVNDPLYATCTHLACTLIRVLPSCTRTISRTGR
jgi:hypothetical protein